MHAIILYIILRRYRDTSILLSESGAYNSFRNKTGLMYKRKPKRQANVHICAHSINSCATPLHMNTTRSCECTLLHHLPQCIAFRILSPAFSKISFQTPPLPGRSARFVHVSVCEFIYFNDVEQIYMPPPRPKPPSRPRYSRSPPPRKAGRPPSPPNLSSSRSRPSGRPAVFLCVAGTISAGRAR